MSTERKMVRNIVEAKCPTCNSAGTIVVNQGQADAHVEVCRSCGGTGKAPVKEEK